MKKLLYILCLILTVNTVLAQTLTSTGAMVKARFHHGSVKLPDGKILAFGGAKQDFNGVEFFNSTELYSPNLGSWIAMANMKLKRSGMAYTILPGGRVLVCGGFDGNSEFASAEIFDVTGGTWSYTDSMSFSRSFHKAVVLNNDKVLIVGGSTITSEIFDPISNTWSVTGNMHFNHGMDFSVTKLNDGRVIVIGGSGKKDSAEIYDPSLGTWAKVNASTVYPRYDHDAILLSNGKVLIAGTTSSSSYKKSELFDPVTNSFIETDSLEENRFNNSMIMLNNGDVMIFGTGNIMNWNNNNIIEIYNVTSNQWYSLDFPGRTGVGKYTLHQLDNGKIILLGGMNFIGDASDSTWLFTPGLVGINKFEDGVVKVYPNPAKDNLYIDVESTEFQNKTVDLKVTDQLGRLIINEQNFSMKNAVLNISEFNDGIYFYSISDKGIPLGSGKFIVIK